MKVWLPLMTLPPRMLSPCSVQTAPMRTASTPRISQAQRIVCLLILRYSVGSGYACCDIAQADTNSAWSVVHARGTEVPAHGKRGLKSLGNATHPLQRDTRCGAGCATCSDGTTTSGYSQSGGAQAG